MSIARPSKQEVERFLVTQNNKRYTGEWSQYLPICFTLTGLTVLFTHSLHRSLSPSGIVPRLLYDRSLSPFYKTFRHFAPTLIILGTFVTWDLYTGLWTDKK